MGSTTAGGEEAIRVAGITGSSGWRRAGGAEAGRRCEGTHRAEGGGR